MTDLNELFEQIYNVEQSFKAEADKLKELYRKIEQGKADVLAANEKYRTKQGELAVKKSTLADLEAEVKVLTVQKNILEEQKQSLNKEKEELTQALAEKKQKAEEETQSLKKELIEFGLNYDLHGAGFKRREEETKKKVDLLQDELLLLKTEMAEMDVQKEELRKLEMELSKEEETLEKQKAKSKELRETLAEQDAETARLEEECKNANQKLSKDPDFIRLQKELEASKECPEEAKCKALRQELKELQERCYHHQMKQQLKRQKSNVQNQPRVPAGRQPGHYNPYTCRYVPAPKTSDSNVSLPSTSSRPSGTSDQRKNNSRELGMKLVDDEWLMTGEEEYLDDDEWDMESLDPDIDDDITTMDSDWSNFDSPTLGMASDGQLRNRDSQVLSSSMFNSQSKSAQSRTSHLRCQPPKSSTAIKTERPQLERETPSRERGTHKHSSEPQTFSTSSVFQKRKSKDRNAPDSGSRSSTLLTDSPEPGCIPRKRSGQSIFKAPGSMPNNPTLPKKAKKVRFHH